MVGNSAVADNNSNMGRNDLTELNNTQPAARATFGEAAISAGDPATAADSTVQKPRTMILDENTTVALGMSVSAPHMEDMFEVLGGGGLDVPLDDYDSIMPR
jgi:hypothetical protein